MTGRRWRNMVCLYEFIRLPPCAQYNAGGDGCQGRRQGRRSSECTGVKDRKHESAKHAKKRRKAGESREGRRFAKQIHPPTLTLVEKASWTLAVRRNESDGLVCYMTLDTDQAPDWEISCSSGSLCSYWIDVDRRPAACGRPSERTSTCICRIVTRPYGAGASLYRYGMVLQCRLSDAQLPCRRMCSSTGTIHPQCFRFSFAQRVC